MIEKLEIFPKILGIFIPPLPFNSPLRTKRRSQTIQRNLKKKTGTDDTCYIYFKVVRPLQNLISHELILIEKPSPWL